jgi:O-antigen/teichoic acid export membrane protein
MSTTPSAPRRSARRSLVFAFIDRYATLGLNIASAMIIARLLTPTEIGVFAVTMAMVGLASTVRDLGTAQYMIQERELTPERVRAVWTVQLAIGLLLGLLVCIAAWPAGRFYNDARMTPIMLLLALNFAINPMGSITYTFLMREMRYEAVAVMRTSSTFAGALTSVGLAFSGAGPISLAWGSVCATLVNATVSLAYRPAGYPWAPGLGEIRRVLSYGSRMTSASVFQSIADAAPEFVLGKMQSLAAAGYFSRANGLVALFQRLVSDVVYSVAMSTFAREAREGHASKETFLRAIAYVTALGWSFSIGLALLAHPAVLFLYGGQWGESVDATRVLALSACLTCMISICHAAAVGYGAVNTILANTLTYLLLYLAVAAIGGPIGLLALAAGAAAALAIVSALWLRTARRLLGLRWRDLIRAAAPSAVTAACAAVGPLASVLVFGWTPASSVAPLALGVVMGALGFLIGMRVSRHPMQEEIHRVTSALSGRFGWLRRGPR